MAIRTVEELVTKWKLDTSKFVRKAGELNREIDKSISKTEGAQKMFQKVGNAANKAGSLLTAGLTLPIAAFGIASIKASSDFEFAMNKARALTGEKDPIKLQALADQAKQLGLTTQFSASQAAEAINFLGLAGFSTNEIMAALPDTLALAGAANLEMAQAADINAKILRGFGLEAEQATRVGDVLTRAFTNANTDLVQLGEGMKYVGPVASSMGVELEETVAALALLSDAGFQAEMGGTALRGALAKLGNVTGSAKKRLRKLGLSVEDVNPQMNSLTDIVRKFEAAGADATDLLAIMGQRAGPGFAALISRGSSELEKFNTMLHESEVTAASINEVMLQGARGGVVKLKSAIGGLLIQVGESGLLDAFTGLVLRLTDVVTWMSKASPTTLKWITILAALAAMLGPLLLIFGQFAFAAAGVLQLTAALSAMGVTMAAVKLMAAGMWSALFAPLLPFIAVIGLLVLAFVMLRNSIKNYGDEWAAVGVSIGRILKKMMSWIAQLGMLIVKAILWPFEWLAKLGGTSLMDGVNEAIGEAKKWSAGTVDPSAIMAERNLAKRGVDNFGRPISAPSNGGGGNTVNMQVTREGDQFVVPNADPRAVAEESRRIAAEKDRDLGRSIRTDMLAGY